MKFFNLLLVLFLATSIFSCGSADDENPSGFSLNFVENKTEFQLGETLKTEIKGGTPASVDSIVYFFAGERIGKTMGKELFQYTFEEDKLGKWQFKSFIYSGGNKTELQKEIVLYNNEPPVLYTYEIIAKYPHAT
ncbi:MAG TPA: hypothetical protein VFI78_05720, partial [Salinimicrobium sp.]|nr:hypothetical protein [Salinimicrobium sp.]